jgi:hypothetical protein
MISSSLSVSPYTIYSPAQSRAEKGGSAPENSDTSLKKENSPETQVAQEDPAKASQEKKLVDELRKTDRAVRAHEQAHLAAAAGLAVSGATFSYQRGPDGQQYAVGGEVSIDASPGRTPEETIAKAASIQAAALAPVDPSAQDRAVAARAAQMKLQAELELAQQKLAAAKGESNQGASPLESGTVEAGQKPAEAQRGIASYRANSGSFTPANGSRIDFAA